jgi:hypothetical protein
MYGLAQANPYMVSVNVNILRSMFIFRPHTRPYGPIFQHDIENFMQAQVMSPNLRMK